MLKRDKTVLAVVYERFIESAPAAVMVRATLERCLSPQMVDELFAREANKQYCHQLLFSTLFSVMSEVVCNFHRSVHASHRARRPQASTSVAALYDKLKGTEPQVLIALVRHTVAELGAVIRQTGGVLASPLPGRAVRIMDGSWLEATERRLAVLRQVQDRALPGKALVVLDPELMLVLEMLPCEDGHAQERVLLPQAGRLVRAGELWIADRNMCTLGWLAAVVGALACFVVRQHGNFPVEALEEFWPVGRNESGTVSEQRVRVVLPGGQEQLWRRIRVQLDKPTRDGEKEVYILTNLPAEEADALKVAELYLGRWTIERMFQEIEASLNCEINTLAYPKAALFGLCVGLVAYNVLSVIKAAMRAAHGVETVAQEVSGYYLAEELEGTGRGLGIALPSETWEPFRQMSSKELAQELVRIARRMYLCRYQKSPRGPKKPQPPRKRLSRGRGSHVSTARLLAAAEAVKKSP